MKGSSNIKPDPELEIANNNPDDYSTNQEATVLPWFTGEQKIAVRWNLEGHHLGWGLLGEPTGHRVFLMGVSHFHVVGGKIVEEWTVYDELAMLAQIKLGALGSVPT